MVASLVRPCVVEPEPASVHKARSGDQVLLSGIHQGQKRFALHKVRMYGCNLYLLKIIK